MGQIHLCRLATLLATICKTRSDSRWCVIRAYPLLGRSCGYSAVLDVSGYPDDVPVPAFGPRLRCERCGTLAPMLDQIGVKKLPRRCSGQPTRHIPISVNLIAAFWLARFG